MWRQRQIRLRPRPRGFHLVTREVAEALPELGEFRVGLAHLHLLHTSASLTLNENASPDVRRDFATWFDRAVPDGAPYWTHTIEGADDMPAHVKSSLLGLLAHAPGPRRRPRARHLAGDLPLRAPRPRRRPLAHRHAAGGVRGRIGSTARVRAQRRRREALAGSRTRRFTPGRTRPGAARTSAPRARRRRAHVGAARTSSPALVRLCVNYCGKGGIGGLRRRA